MPLPNWILAVTVVATLGVSTVLSTGVTSHPARTAAPSAAQSGALTSNPAARWTGATVSVETSIAPGSDGRGRVAILQGQVTSMNADLQNIQRQNDTLRNLSRQQASDLTSERSNLAASQDLLSGESRDLGARLSTMQQELAGRVPGLQGAAKAAADVVNEIRKMLGMPEVTLPSG